MDDCASDFLSDLIDSIRDWLIGKYGMTTFNDIISDWSLVTSGATFGDESQQGRFCIESAYNRTPTSEFQSESWACRITEFPKCNIKYIPRKWITEIGYQTTGEKTGEISYSVKYIDLVREYKGKLQWKPALSLPKVVRFILSSEQWTCLKDGQLIDEESVTSAMPAENLFGLKECLLLFENEHPQLDLPPTEDVSEEIGMDERVITEEIYDAPIAPAINSGHRHFNFLDLSEAELSSLCHLLQPKGVKSYFQKNPKEFARIKGGFRPTSLSDEETILLVIRNIAKPFISSMVERIVNGWLDEIHQFRTKLENEGATADESLIEALPNCVFAHNIDLFFRLACIEHSEDYIGLVKAIVSKQLANPSITNTPTPSAATVATEEYEALSSELLQIKEALSTEQAGYAATLLELQNTQTEKENIARQLETVEAQYRAANSRTSQMQSELDDLKKLAKYADTEVVEAEASEYGYMSVCQIFCDHYSGQIWLSRLADISNGEISRFVRDETQPYYFGNRDRLFWRDGPREEGTIGVWRWNAVPNKTDPSTDYVTTSFSKNIRLTQIIDLPDCKTIKEITDYLLANSIPIQATKKLFFALAEANGKIAGLLCNENDFDYINGEAKLKSSIYTLPQFIINASDIITLAGRSFYHATNLGAPQDIYQLRSPLSVVKDVVVARATNATLRLSGLSKREAQHCQGFLKELPILELAAEVAEAYECSLEEATEYVSSFVGSAISYLEGTDVDTETLARAVTRAPELQTRCKEILEAEWKAENEARIHEAQDHLSELIRRAEEMQAEYETTAAKHLLMTEDLTRIQNSIDEQRNLASSVEERVAKRISEARADAAAFISEVAFTSAIVGKQSIELPAPSKAVGNGYLTHRAINSVPEEMLTNLEDFIDELAENLKCCGYDGISSAHMAQAITFCISKKSPIICGSNTDIIVDCIASMFGTGGAYAVSLPIGMDNLHEYYEAISNTCKEKQQVFAINGVFDGYSLNTFNELMQNYAAWTNTPVLVLSMHGMKKEAIPSYVWDRCFYIDGDAGLVNLPIGDKNVFEADLDFVIECAPADYQEKRKLLKPYARYLSNTATMRYAQYMVFSNGTVKTEPMIQTQLLLNALANGYKDDVIELLKSDNIDPQKNTFLSNLI